MRLKRKFDIAMVVPMWKKSYFITHIVDAQMNAKQPFNESKHTEQPAKSNSHTDDCHELVYFSDSETYSTTSEVRFIKLLILIMIQFDLGISNETCLFEIII